MTKPSSDDSETEYQRLNARIRELERELAAERMTCRAADDALLMAQTIIDRSPVVLFRRVAGENPGLVYVSSNIARFGYTAESFVNEEILFKDIIHPDDFERVGREIRAYADAGVHEYSQHYRILTRDGDVRWVEDQTSVVRDAADRITYNQGIIVDVTERREAERKLRRSEEKYRRIIETTGEGFILMDAGLRIIDANDSYVRMLGRDKSDILGKTPLDLATPEFRNFMIAHHQRLLSMDHRKLEGRLMAADGREVPVLIHGNTLLDDAGHMLGHVAMVTDLSEQKQMMALAGRVQRNLSPPAAPHIPGFDVAGRSVPVEEVGGDYYDFLFGPGFGPDRLRVVVGDISGHGVDAALLMTSARTSIRMLAAGPGGPADVISAMNRQFSLDVEATGHFMTLFYLEIDRNGIMHWVRAGHEPGLVYYPNEDRFAELTGIGIPVGIDEAFFYPEQTMDGLPPGTVIVLGTDGIWEAMNVNHEPFGRERLSRVIRERATESSQAIIDAVFEEMSAFTQGLSSHDDVTLVVIKVGV